jgi:DNA-binding transcriptional ArsR family regulator
MTPRPRPTGRDADTASAPAPAGARLLHLLARLPLAPVEVLARLCGMAGPSAVYRHLDRLRASGLADACRVPLGPRRAHRLWHPTDRGLATLGQVQGLDPTDLARRHHLRRSDLLARLRHLPGLLALYRLLGALAAAGPGAPQLLDWEAPWRCSSRRIDTGARVAVRLPARVAVA